MVLQPWNQTDTPPDLAALDEDQKERLFAAVGDLREAQVFLDTLQRECASHNQMKFQQDIEDCRQRLEDLTDDLAALTGLGALEHTHPTDFPDLNAQDYRDAARSMQDGLLTIPGDWS